MDHLPTSLFGLWYALTASLHGAIAWAVYRHLLSGRVEEPFTLLVAWIVGAAAGGAIVSVLSLAFRPRM
ncbi:MAG: hypothetical protein RMK94_12770 [Armatimonadota bacterium]|nr:hypothetical protein [Armatimonadota bacterium]